MPEHIDAIAEDLRATVVRAAAGLRALSEAAASTAPVPGKWSPKQVVGHLVDSASNNHGRFVRAQLQEELVFAGYAQDEWVERQRYAEAPWPALVDLFEALNLHLVRVIVAIPASERERPRPEHNLDVVAWETPPPDEPVTLAFFLRDYVNHLRHHLRQIDPAFADAPVPQGPSGRR